MTPEKREDEMRKMLEEEQRQDALKAKGVVFFTPTEEERKMLEQINRLATMAKYASKQTTQAVKAFRNGKLETVEPEPVGNFEEIFRTLLIRRLGSAEGAR